MCLFILCLLTDNKIDAAARQSNETYGRNVSPDWCRRHRTAKRMQVSSPHLIVSATWGHLSEGSDTHAGLKDKIPFSYVTTICFLTRTTL